MYQLSDELMGELMEALCIKDPVMADIFQQYGQPPLWARPQSFATLVHIVLEQKISLASANAVMHRVRKLCPTLQPADFLRLSEAELRDAGLSERKISYCRSIAGCLLEKRLSLASLPHLDDESVLAELTKVRGIGPWTAGVYLMMALKRVDAWASGDRALAVSYAECRQLAEVPGYAALDEIARGWQPYRGIAARLLWHAYLQKRRRGS